MNYKTIINSALLATLAAFASVAGAQSATPITIGTGAYASSGIAIGTNAMQGDVSAGSFSATQPAYTGGIAIGQGANASGKNIALGQGISAPQDGIEGAYTLAIGGFNSITGTTDYRRVVGMADGLFATDGATLGQVWQLNAQTLSAANSYTDSGINAVNQTLADHDTRITNAQNTADSAMTTAQGADAKASTALSQSGQAIAIAQETQRQVVQLTGRVDAIDKRVSALESRMDGFDRRVNGSVALSSAMNAAIAPALAPGESSLVGGIGGFRGQAAVAIGIVHTNYAGQSFTAKVSTSSIGTAYALGGAVKF